MKIRTVLALSALIASGLATTATAAPKAKKPAIPACPSFTDALKDDFNADTPGLGEDPALDIVKVTESVKGNTFIATMQVAKFGDPTYADGAQYTIGFVSGGKTVTLFGTHSRSKPAMDVGFALTGIEVDGTYVKGSEALVTYSADPATNTITLKTTLSNLATAVGTRVAGTTVSGLQAQIAGVFVALLEPYDEAAAAPSAKLTLAECR